MGPRNVFQYIGKTLDRYDLNWIPRYAKSCELRKLAFVVPTRLEQADRIHQKLLDLRGAAVPTDRRTLIPVLLGNLAVDHFSSVILLMRHGCYGSALALVRVIYEAMMRAYWIYYCAEARDLDSIGTKDSYEFPSMQDMADLVDQNYFSRSGLSPFAAIKQNVWKSLNSFTHSGLRQLRRQVDEDGIRPSYPDGELDDALRAAGAFALFAGWLIANITDQDEKAFELVTLMENQSPRS